MNEYGVVFMLKNVNKYIIRFILSTVLIMLFNSIAMRYNFSLPLNIFNVAMITVLGIPGFIVAIIIKTFL